MEKLPLLQTNGITRNANEDNWVMGHRVWKDIHPLSDWENLYGCVSTHWWGELGNLFTLSYIISANIMLGHLLVSV